MNLALTSLCAAALLASAPVPVVSSLASFGGQAPASERWVVAVEDLEFTDAVPGWASSAWMGSPVGATLLPRAVVEGYAATLAIEGVQGSSVRYAAIRGGDIALEGPAPEGELRGELLLPNPGSTHLVRYPFTFAAGDVEQDDFLFDVAQASRYNALAGSGVTGTPWFRRRARAFGDSIDDLPPEPSIRQRSRTDTYAMFTGGRALAENLALDDVIRGASDGEAAAIPLSAIEGVRVPEMNWGPLVKGIEPELDALSTAVPFDQHAVFFPSFGALVDVVDQLQDDAAPIVHFFDGRAEDAGVRERYQAQMCLSLDALTRRFGGTFIRSVAVTGSDPYLRTGSDVAVLLEGDVAAITAFLRARIDAAAMELDVEVETDSFGPSEVVSAVTADRRLCAHMAATDGFVVVSNSRPQLERVLDAQRDGLESLADLPEFRWFRDRYRLGDAAEDALVVVSDATIRRWASPRWRIATSRRTNAAAVLADADAFRIADRYGRSNAGALPEVSPVLGGGVLATDGPLAMDSNYGRLSFLTPIAEMDMDLVTPAEKTGYEAWRRGYERAWGTSFDPLCVRIDVHDDGLDVDLTLVPLIVQSSYRDMIGFAGAALLTAESGDPHEGTLAHWICAIDRKGPWFQRVKGDFGSLLPGGLDWLGDHMEVWVDHDEEYLERVRETDSFDMFTEEMLPGLPVGVRFDVDSALGLAGFLGGMRSMAESAVPDLFEFNERESGGHKYVAIEVSDGAGFEETPTIFYAVIPGAFVVSFSQKVIESAMERGYAGEGTTARWSGQSTALNLGGAFQDAAAVEMIDLATREELRARSWANLAILNEWRRLGAEDPVAFHEAEWGIRLVCPGGGEYVWNEADRTMESSAYGHPAAPKDGPGLPAAIRSLTSIDLGLRFEEVATTAAEPRAGGRVRTAAPDMGLRATARLRR